MKERLRRLRLFDTCVTQAVLWCCESWTLTQVEKQKLRTVQNDMLRRMVGPRRGAEEDWVDWIKRSTRAARKIAEDAGIRFWVEAQVQKKWSWAGHVSRMAADRLAKKATTWRDSFWWATEQTLPSAHRFKRPHRTRWFRWEDELRRFASTHLGGMPWQDAAKCRMSWQSHSEKFVRRAAAR